MRKPPVTPASMYMLRVGRTSSINGICRNNAPYLLFFTTWSDSMGTRVYTTLSGLYSILILLFQLKLFQPRPTPVNRPTLCLLSKATPTSAMLKPKYQLRKGLISMPWAPLLVFTTSAGVLKSIFNPASKPFQLASKRRFFFTGRLSLDLYSFDDDFSIAFDFTTFKPSTFKSPLPSSVACNTLHLP